MAETFVEIDQNTGDVFEVTRNPLSPDNVETRVEAILESIRGLESALNSELAELGKWVPTLAPSSNKFTTVMDTIEYYQKLQQILDTYQQGS